MKKSYIVILAVIILAIGGYLVLGSRGQPGESGEEESKSTPAQVISSFVKGQPAPETTFTDFDGATYSLVDFAGKAVVLDFWAAWCPFCVEEMPELQKAQDTYNDELVMIGVHRSDTESKSTGLEFTQDRDISYLLVTDPDGSLYRAAGGFGMPVAVFIDKTGVVQEIKSGPKTSEEIEEKVSNLIEK